MLKAGLNVVKEAGSRKFMSEANKLSVTNSHVSPKIVSNITAMVYRVCRVFFVFIQILGIVKVRVHYELLTDDDFRSI